MSPGRHRHSPPLHKLLPASAIAVVSVMCAAGTWFSLEPVVLRVLAAGAAAAAVVGAVVMRSWDRTAGRRVAELARVRQSEGWAHEERVAELEGDLEESREIRTALEGKLRAKRAELAALRNEHAVLLRRYATAETERASALEGRRLLAIEAAPARASLSAGLTPAQAARVTPVTAEPGRRVPSAAAFWGRQAESSEVEQVWRRSGGPERAAGPTGPVSTPVVPTPALFLRANAALDSLTTRTDPSPAHRRAVQAGPHGKALPGTGQFPGQAPSRASEAQDDGGHQRADGSSQARGRHPVSHAAAVVPPAAPARSVPAGGFDFFGTKAAEAVPESAATGPAPSSAAPQAAALSTVQNVQNEDLADVVGEEALAAHQAEAATGEKASATKDQQEVGQVIDLTAHDETEQLDLSQLRNAVS